MSDTAALLDEARRRLGLTSDNALAKALRWPQSTIANYRSGTRHMNARQMLDFYEKTGIDPEAIMRAAARSEDRATRQTVGRKAA